jgi:hypothetical protein
MRGSRSEIGTEKIAQNGYHYTKTDSGWRLTHHIVAEQTLGRPLAPDERAVFSDGDRTNLDPENIEVRRKATASLRRKEANLVARIQELQAQLEETRRQIKKKLGEDNG